MSEPEQIAPEAPPPEALPQEASSPADTDRPEPADHAPEPRPCRRSRNIRKTRRSLLVGGLATLAGLGGWEWLRSRRSDDGIPWPLRVALETNEELSRDYFRDTRLARTFAPSDVEEPRQNGDIGLDEDVDPNWKLTVDGASASDQSLTLSLDEIKALPKVEMITQLNCIEGWSRILKWGGVRFRDFAGKYAPRQNGP